eukprot:scaffold2788_cov376-Prasinococcus_capsulatus_cf.AAC.8
MSSDPVPNMYPPFLRRRHPLLPFSSSPPRSPSVAQVSVVGCGPVVAARRAEQAFWGRGPCTGVRRAGTAPRRIYFEGGEGLPILAEGHGRLGPKQDAPRHLAAGFVRW